MEYRAEISLVSGHAHDGIAQPAEDEESDVVAGPGAVLPPPQQGEAGGWAALDDGLGPRLLARSVTSSCGCAAVRLVCKRWASFGAAARLDLAPAGLLNSSPPSAWLTHFCGLRHLDLGAFPTYRPPAAELAALRGLRSLKLRLLQPSRPPGAWEQEAHSEDSDAWLPTVLAALGGSLTSLDLSGSLDLGNNALGGLALPHLHTLDLSGTHLSETALSCLAGVTGLTRLDLSNCRNCRSCGPLTSLVRLQSLSLNGCNMRDSGLQALGGLTSLRHLSLNGCRQLTSAGLTHLSALRALASLEAPGCVGLRDAGLQALSGLAELETLNLGRWSDSYFPHVNSPGVDYCCLLTDATLVALEPFSRLRSLDLDGNKSFTDRGMSALASLPELRNLRLGGCTSVTDAGLASLSGLTNLRELQLAHFIRVTDTGLSALQPLSCLRSLVLNDCHQLTDRALELLQEMDGLQSLYLHGCHQLSLSGVQALRAATSMYVVWYAHPNEWVEYHGMA